MRFEVSLGYAEVALARPLILNQGPLLGAAYMYGTPFVFKIRTRAMSLLSVVSLIAITTTYTRPPVACVDSLALTLGFLWLAMGKSFG